MSWVDDKINEWLIFSKTPFYGIVVPSLQVGVLLDRHKGNIKTALEECKYNQRIDAQLQSFAHDKYWYEVERIIIENIVHHEILNL